jgi:DNA-binding CsgD family transcriptional regulator
MPRIWVRDCSIIGGKKADANFRPLGRLGGAGHMERTGSVEQLIRMVVGCSPQNHNACGPDFEESQVEEVLFDVEVDGARYLLVRLPKPIQRDVQLSPREQEIVRLVALGHSNKMIAGVLNISSWTVCTHLRRIFSKLGVGSRPPWSRALPRWEMLG